MEKINLITPHLQGSSGLSNLANLSYSAGVIMAKLFFCWASYAFSGALLC